MRQLDAAAVHQTWTTQHIASARRADFWRDAVCQAFLAMTPRLPRSTDFAARLDHTSIERLALNRVQAPAHGVTRSPHDLARGGAGCLFLNLQLAGRGWVRQAGRDHRAAAGELMLIDSREPYMIDLLDGGILLSLAVPADVLDSAVPGLEHQVARPVRTSAAAHLLIAQMQTLAACAPSLDQAQVGVVSDTLVVLATTALTAPAAAAGAQSSLRRRVQVLIARHLHDPAFNPAQAASQAGVSVRSVHAAMASAGTTFGAVQMEYRLQRAHQMLVGAQGLASVTSVSGACGFVSAEHFSRRFRARFGCTPGSCLRSRNAGSIVGRRRK